MKYSYASGSWYEGETVDGNFQGVGKFYFYNGDLYEGNFKDGYPHGIGKMIYKNGNVYEGLWMDGSEAEGKKTLAKFTTDEKYYALIIGNNEYDHLEDLDNAVNDAVDLEKVLSEKYGFETTLLLNADKDKTLDAIINFTDSINYMFFLYSLIVILIIIVIIYFKKKLKKKSQKKDDYPLW